MSLLETYLGNVENVKKMNPGAELIVVMRGRGHILSPSWPLLNDYLAKRIDWDGYIERFLKEMQDPKCIEEMKRIGELAKRKDVYLVCQERVGHCHRFLLVDIIKKLALEEGCKRLNQLVIDRPDLVEKARDNIARALSAEA